MSSTRKVERMLARGDMRGLCRALKDRDLLVRRRAAQALGELGQPEAVPHLAEIIYSGGDQYAIRWGLDALARIGTPEAIDTLIGVMFSLRTDTARIAERALAATNSSRAEVAQEVRDAILRNDFDALGTTREHQSRILEIVMRSEQYASWPSGKRKAIASAALQSGSQPSPQHTGELAEMGVFVSGVHTLGDLLRSLRHPNPAIRSAAAEKLGLSGLKIARGPLYRRFKREAGQVDAAEVAASAARALLRLGDKRPLTYFQRQLYYGDGTKAALAARGLGAIGTPEAALILFRFLAEPPPPPGYRNTQVALNALSDLGVDTLDALIEFAGDQGTAGKRILAELLVERKHPQAVVLLTEIAYHNDVELRSSALHGFVKLNNRAAALALRDLADILPREQVIEALAEITDPAGPEYLRALLPTSTVLRGVVFDDRWQQMAGVTLQAVHSFDYGGRQGHGWKPVSVQTTSDEQGNFALSLPRVQDDWHLYLKIATPRHPDGGGELVFYTDLGIEQGAINTITVRFDVLFSRVMLSSGETEPRR